MAQVDIKRVLKAIDLRDYEFFGTLTQEEQKSISPYVLMRFVSNVNGGSDVQEWFIERTNELVNKDHWYLSKHKELHWKLLASCGFGSVMFHQYTKVASKEKVNKIEKLLAELNPCMKLDDVKLLASMMTKAEKNELFDSLGFDAKQRKEYN